MDHPSRAAFTPGNQVLLCIGLLGPASMSAAICSDYPNQAAAQRAADTRDADGDGVYCESLPCPCVRPGDGGRPRPTSPPKPRARPRAQRICARIVEVIDGDTIRVRARGARRRTYTVRLIGIDTPETRKPGTPVECGGKEATANMLRLSFSAPDDSYADGLLAYVETRSGRQLNVAQVAAGWAETYVFNCKSFRQVSRFRAAERRAHGARRGAWASCGVDFHRPAAAARSAQRGSVCSRRLALRTLRRAAADQPARCPACAHRHVPDLPRPDRRRGARAGVHAQPRGQRRRRPLGHPASQRLGRLTVAPWESGRGFGIRLENDELAVASPVYRSGDPGCCPTGGWRIRRFGWNGARFTVRSSRIEADVPRGFYDR